MPPIFVFLRHAEASHNLAYRENSQESVYNDPAHADSELTATGRAQATKAAALLESQEFTAIYCSPLRRCRQTLLNAIPDAYDKTVYVDDRLMEPQSHLCNRRQDRRDLIADVPLEWDIDQVADQNPFLYDTPETPNEIIHRIIGWTGDICKRYPNGRILVVSHYQWIRIWHRIFHRLEVHLHNAQWVIAPGPDKKVEPARRYIDERPQHNTV